MKRDLAECAWPMEQAGEAMEALARACGLPFRSTEALRSFDGSSKGDRLTAATRWLETNAAAMGIEVESIQAPYSEVDRLLRGAGPALVRIEHDGRPMVLALRSGSRSAASLIAPDLSRRRVSIASIRMALCRPIEEPLGRDTEQLLDEAGVRPRRRSRVRAALLREQLAGTNVSGCWLLRTQPGASIRAQGSLARVWTRLAVLAGAHSIAYALWIVSWWILGRAALDGRLDRGWLSAWALLLLTIVPFELLVTWLQGRISIDAGGLLKRRLLYGALQLDPDEIRHEGAGQLLGRVIESQAIEALTLTGGFLALTAGLELTMAAVVLMTATAWLGWLLLLSVAAGGILAWRFFVRRKAWTGKRLAMTHQLVEHLVGHRTRTAQQPRESWHESEDQTLEQYVAVSSGMDRAAVSLMALAPRGWLLLAVLGLGPLFVSGSAPVATLAVALGGILLAFRAFRRLSSGLTYLAGAAIAWTQAAPVFHAAARPRVAGSPGFSRPAAEPSETNGLPLLDGNGLAFRHPGRSEPVLRGCDLQVRHGERLLLQGPSGGGKSTLASLLTGLRVPDSGLLLLHGVDRKTLGADEWRRLIVAVPQFHENHIFMGTLAFNLLMGAEWPPRQEDFERVETLCRELGLGDLLKRMPAGLLQQVGETGWQLSHGERSRVCIARALLQGGEFLVLDESFAQLDPESLQGTLRCVLERAPTIMVIAHP